MKLPGQYPYSVLARVVIQAVGDVKSMYSSNTEAIELWSFIVADTSETIDMLLMIEGHTFVEKAVQARILHLLICRI